MKKNSLLVLLAAVGLMVSCNGTTSSSEEASVSSEDSSSSEVVVAPEAAFFGFGSKAAYSTKGTAGTSGQYLQIDITVGAFLFDADGAVVKAYVDVMQVKVNSCTHAHKQEEPCAVQALA